MNLADDQFCEQRLVRWLEPPGRETAHHIRRKQNRRLVCHRNVGAKRPIPRDGCAQPVGDEQRGHNYGDLPSDPDLQAFPAATTWPPYFRWQSSATNDTVLVTRSRAVEVERPRRQSRDQIPIGRVSEGLGQFLPPSRLPRWLKYVQKQRLVSPKCHSLLLAAHRVHKRQPHGKAECRRITRQLNEGESPHALRRDLRYAHGGAFTSRHLAGQTEQAWCLTVLTNAVVTWTTEHYGLAVASLRAEGRYVDDEALAHISPAHSENVNFFGTIDVDIESELAKLDGTGYRPLREAEPVV